MHRGRSGSTRAAEVSIYEARKPTYDSSDQLQTSLTAAVGHLQTLEASGKIRSKADRQTAPREVSRLRAVFSFCASIFGAGICLLTLSLDFQHYALARQAQSWPKAQGRILDSHAEPDCDRNGNFSLSVSYEYFAGATKYVGHRRGFGVKLCRSRASIETEALRFPPGRSVDVFVDPKIPSESALEVDFDPHTPRAFLAGEVTFAVLFAVASAFFYRPAFRRRSSTTKG
jgi:hypothetical protein